MSDEETYDYGELLVVQHGDQTGPSNLEAVFDARAGRRPWRTVRPDRGEPLPTDLARVRGVVVLGGFMGVRDRDELAWLDAEIGWVAETVAAGVPVFGICLGHQILGEALGGRVERRDAPEIGFFPLERTEGAGEDEIFAGWVDGAHALLIHDDQVVEFPDDAVPMLSGSDGIPAWRAGDGLSYGVQFHPETSFDLFREWAARDANLPRFELAGVSPDEMVAEFEKRRRFLRAAGLSLVGRWLDGVVGRDDPTPRRKKRAA